MIKTFRDLEVYLEAYKLMLIIHKSVLSFPIKEDLKKNSKLIPLARDINI